MLIMEFGVVKKTLIPSHIELNNVTYLNIKIKRIMFIPLKSFTKEI